MILGEMDVAWMAAVTVRLAYRSDDRVYPAAIVTPGGWRRLGVRLIPGGRRPSCSDYIGCWRIVIEHGEDKKRHQSVP